ncbi:MAG: S8 family serine peptidase [Melioribacteraceae bacterium]
MKFTVILIALYILRIELIGQNSSSANKNKPDHPKFIFDIEKPGHISSLATRNNGKVEIHDFDLTEKIKVIVEFKDKPIFIAQKENKLLKINSTTYTSQFSIFIDDINKYNTTLAKNLKVNLPSIQIEREFYKIFNGVSITIPKGLINSIYSLDYVKKVHSNGRVKAFENESNHIIKADSVWNEFGVEGDSIVIGILDTGIDYLHPALGGGFGKNWKVIGGYDIINEDNDPMDDNGHGTHVAGIVSANTDSIKGVAPKSLLMAFKVLDNSGYGDDSQVLDGIERVLDPNNDGNNDDKVDIVNMSLGDVNGNPDDAISTAVNNAVELGVIFCISAGNSGNYNSIGSPGTAEKAITVGSTDKSDEISYFSSKGPNKKYYTIKPDILAPGNNVLSTLPRGFYEQLSGTSMASPQVAGVCALLKQIHNDWTPEMIKSAIMTTAKDISSDKMAQGAGRIDALKAAKISTMVSPSSLSYGRDIDTLNHWVKYDTLEITNLNSSSQTYSIIINGQINGISLEPNINNFSLEKGETQQLIFTLSVDNTILPNPSDSAFAYNGNLYINGEIDSLHLPWAFVKKPLLVFNTDILPLYYLIYNDNFSFFRGSRLDSTFDNASQTEIMLDPGVYNIVFNFDDFANENRKISYVVKENVEIYGSKEITINSTDALNLIQFKGVDENGTLLDTINSLIDCSFLSEDVNFGPPFSYFFPASTNFKTNNFNNFDFYFRQLAIETKEIHKIRIINYPKKVGMNGNYTFSNSPNNYLKQKFRISLVPDTKISKVMLGYHEINKFWGIIMLNPIFQIFNVNDIKDGEIFIVPNIDTSKTVIKRSFFVTNIDTFNNEIIYQPDGSWFATGYFDTNNGKINIQDFPYVSIKSFMFNNFKEPMISNANLFNFGDGAVYTNLDCGNSKSVIRSYPSFYGQLNEYRESDLYNSFYQIYDNSNNLIISDSLINYEPFQVSTGKYKFIVKNNHYTVDGKWGNSTTTAEFDLALEDPNPPTINSLQILNSEGIISSKMHLNEKCKIVFSVNGFDQNSYLYLKKEADSVWTEVTLKDTVDLQNNGKYYTADLSNFTKYDSTAIDLKINIIMTNNNKNEMILRPAFIVNYWDGITDVESDLSSEILKTNFSLEQNYPNPFNPTTKISYTIPISMKSEKVKVQLMIYDILGRKVKTLVDKIQNAGNYEVEFNASLLPSGIYFYKLQTGNNTITKKMILLK